MGFQTHVQRALAHNQRGVGSRMGSGNDWGWAEGEGKMETTVLE